MSSPVWAVEDKVAWNYIIVADAHIKGSSADIYRYNNSMPAKGLPVLDLVSSSTFIGLEPVLKSVWGDKGGESNDVSHGTPEEEGLYEQLLKMIVDWGNKHVPDVQRSRTPLFFYGTGSVRSVNMFDKHKLMSTACDFFKRESTFLIGDCGKQVKAIHEDLEGILSWIAASYRESIPSQGLKPTSGTILLGNSGCTTVYADPNGAKSNMYKVSLPLGDKTVEMYDLNVHTDDSLGFGEAWDKYIASGKAACLFPGSKQHEGKGTGNFKECTSEIKSVLNPEISSEMQNLPNVFSWYASGELPGLHKLIPSVAKAETVCSSTWQDLDKSLFPIGDLDRMCFKSAYYRDLLEGLFPNGKVPDISYPVSKWTLGRAVMYAAEDVSNKNSKKPVGIQTNSGTTVWQFSGDVTRPLLGDWVDKLDGSSHRFYGAMMMISLLGAVLYFMAGKRRRAQVFSVVRGKHSPRNLSTDEFELPRFQT